MLRETFELMLALIHVPQMHNKIYDSKRPYTTKYFGNANIFYIGNSQDDNKTFNPMILFLLYKNRYFQSLVPTIDNREIFLVNTQANARSTI
jgi:hypothetical protein